MKELLNLSFEKIVERTRLVILECPWQNWENDHVRDMFSKMALLKKKGYGPHWGQGMMPVDATDLVGDHVIACYETPSGELIPFTAGRSITKKVCDTYHQEYPPMDYFKSDKNLSNFVSITNDYLDNKYKGKKVSYYSSWTIDPRFREIDRKISRYSKDLYSALTYFYHNHYDISHFFCFAVLNFKTDDFFGSWGCERVQSNGEQLPDIVVPRYSDYQLGYMKLEKFSHELETLAGKYKDLWDNRVTMNLDYKGTSEDSLERRAA